MKKKPTASKNIKVFGVKKTGEKVLIETAARHS